MPTEKPSDAMAEHRKTTKTAVRWFYLQSLVLTLILFFVHIVLIFDVAGSLLETRSWFLDHFGAHDTGKIMVLGTFLILFFAHILETVVWGMFLRWKHVVPNFLDGIYYVGATISTLGYGDIVLNKPWRQMGALIAISGVLKFGCSTAFLFFVIQNVWSWKL